MNEEKYKSSWTKYEKTRDLLSGIDPIEDAFRAGYLAASCFSKTPDLSESEISGEAVYGAYPRKVGKAAALKAIKTALTKLHIQQYNGTRGTAGFERPIDFLFDRTKAYAAAVAKWPAEDRQFVPHPATWFNQGRYDDDPKEWIRGTKPANGRVSASNIKFVE